MRELDNEYYEKDPLDLPSTVKLRNVTKVKIILQNISTIIM